MKTYTRNREVKIIAMTKAQICKLLTSDFRTITTANINHDQKIDVVFNARSSDSVHVSRDFEDMVDQFPELQLHHAYDGLSGDSFEFTVLT